MQIKTAYLFNKAPALRLLTAFIAGIIAERYGAFPLAFLLLGLGSISVFMLVFSLLSLTNKFRFRVVGGLCLCALIFIAGAILLYLRNVTHNKYWIGNYKDQTAWIATIEEPLIEKTNTWKAVAKVSGVIIGDSLENASGRLILYCKKDGKRPVVGFGSRILIKSILQQIKNTGNPGSFDYQDYCLSQGVTHQVFLTEKNYSVLNECNGNGFQQLIFHSRRLIISILHRSIRNRIERGMAEALLIGYKDDLDRTLVQSYTSAGVVHIIAISGMHLALIYTLLMWMTSILEKRRGGRFLRFLIVVSGLWLFSLLAGAQPSVLRSALIFTCMATAVVISRRTEAINSLGLSAFILLCFNPFWLWDVGFQLSYAAVLSILIFLKPISSIYYFNNKILQQVWTTICVCLAAQILTMPFCVYYFHQLPLLFLLTNLVAVPLSGFIVLAEIILCLVWAMPFIGAATSFVILHAIRFLDAYIERFAFLPFATWDRLSISLPQALLLAAMIAGLAHYTISRKRYSLWTGILSFFTIIVLRSASIAAASRQLQLIVYNIPHQQAIEIVSGTRTFLVGSIKAFSDPLLYKQFLLPSHTLLRINDEEGATALPTAIVVNGKLIVVIDATTVFSAALAHRKIDILIISGRPPLRFELPANVEIKHGVIDPSVPFQESLRWKKRFQCTHVLYTDIRESGAFQMNL